MRVREGWKQPFERRISTNQTEKPQPTCAPFRCRVCSLLAGKLQTFRKFSRSSCGHREDISMVENLNLCGGKKCYAIGELKARMKIKV